MSLPGRVTVHHRDEGTLPSTTAPGAELLVALADLDRNARRQARLTTPGGALMPPSLPARHHRRDCLATASAHRH
ncbi:MAG: hypothetical protein ACRDRU_03525 [Pseudonocardiaceae bacterium]